MIKNEIYTQLLEEIDATITEGNFTKNMALVETYHTVGGIVTKAVESGEFKATELVKEICLDLKKSEKIVWDAYKFYREYPQLEALPMGKEATWTGVRKLLGSGEKTDVEIDLAKIARGLIRRYGDEDSSVIAQTVLDTLQSSQEAL